MLHTVHGHRSFQRASTVISSIVICNADKMLGDERVRCMQVMYDETPYQLIFVEKLVNFTIAVSLLARRQARIVNMSVMNNRIRNIESGSLCPLVSARQSVPKIHYQAFCQLNPDETYVHGLMGPPLKLLSVHLIDQQPFKHVTMRSLAQHVINITTPHKVS